MIHQMNLNTQMPCKVIQDYLLLNLACSKSSVSWDAVRKMTGEKSKGDAHSMLLLFYSLTVKFSFCSPLINTWNRLLSNIHMKHFNLL